MHRFSYYLSYFTGVRNGRQRSPNIAVEVEILKILPKNTNKLVNMYSIQFQFCSLICKKKVDLQFFFFNNFGAHLTEVAGEGGTDCAPQKFLSSQKFRHLMG